MKKLSFLLILLVFAVAFCGCNNNKTLTQEHVSSAPSVPAETLPTTARITFPEGKTLVEIAQMLEDKSVCSAEGFVKACEDVEYFKEKYSYDFLETVNTETAAFPLEGYIFPDTYDFYIGEDAYSVVGRFLANFNKRFDDTMKNAAAEKGMTINDVVILASIVQDECSFIPEMPNVASVFTNRIISAAYKRLQSDVTINYVNKYITDSPYELKSGIDYAAIYNTYKCNGLPAGAVCCPGIEAMRAALNPSDTPYYFFVTDADNNYYYAENYEKHLENCRICGY